MSDYNSLLNQDVTIDKVPQGKAEGVIGWINRTEKGEDGIDKIKTKILFKDFEDASQLTKEAVEQQPELEIKSDDKSVDILAKAIVDKINNKNNPSNIVEIPKIGEQQVIGGKRRGKSMRKLRNNGGTAKKHRRHRRKSHMNNN